MSVHTIPEAQGDLSRLFAEAMKGGEVVIAHGDESVRLVPTQVPAPKRKRVAGSMKGLVATETLKAKRVFGSMHGLLHIDDRFFEPLPDDELALWNGEGD